MSLPPMTMDQTSLASATMNPALLSDPASRAPNNEALQRASRMLDRFLARDFGAPTLVDQFTHGNTALLPTVSGLSDHDYPSLAGLPPSVASKAQVKTLMKVPLPPEIMEHFNHMQCHCMMGLFPEIGRAWLTIDSDIYVWTFEDGGDVAYYDGLNDTIIGVGLIRPKQGVFQSFIRYLLVITTAVDIVVLGVTFTSSEDDCMHEIQLVSDPVFSIPTDGKLVTSIMGTSIGRLFLGSKDGNLYEITYQAESSWFGKRCRKINHSTSRFSYFIPTFAYAALVEDDSILQVCVDDSRHLLYVLTEKGYIEVWDLGENGTTTSRAARLSQSSLVTQAVSTVKTLDGPNFHPIVSISPVELSESTRVYLVATAHTGVRLYLTCITQSQINNPLARPTTLQLVHVRVPPGYSATTLNKPRNVHMASYRDRNALMISTVNEKEILWSMGSDLFPFCNNFYEAFSTLEMDGPVLAMAEVRLDMNMLLQPTQQVPPLIVRQHSEPPRKYVVLTSMGAHIIVKLRPVDVLRQLLLETHGQDSEAMKTFFNFLVDEQACSTSLILASLESPHNAEISDMATNAFFVYGGEPKLAMLMPQPQASMNVNLNQTQFNSPSLFMPNMMSTPMAPLAPYTQQPQFPPQSPQQQQQQQQHMSQHHHQQLQHQPPVNFNITPQSPYGSMAMPYASPNQSYMYQGTMNSVYTNDLNAPFLFSAKHNGLYLYLGRILRPLWNLRCVERMTLDGKKFYLTSTVNNEECGWILTHLTSLKTFMNKNTQLSICNNLSKPGNQAANNTTLTSRGNYSLQDAQLEERQSLDSLKLFVNHATQVLGLWKILCEHQFHVLMDKLPAVNQQAVLNTCFKDLFLFGQDICSMIINTLINSYLGDNASVDSISSKLRETCPSLYKVEDAACSKANEILKTAKMVNNLDEKDELLQSALVLCKNVAPNVNTKEICEQFTSQKAYKAVVDLCVTCAKSVDPEDVALHFYKNGDQNDQDGYNYYLRRMEIYKQVVTMLDTVYTQNDGSQNVTNINGLNTVSMEGSNNITRQIILDVLKQPDELLHIAVYEWMLNKQLNSELVMVTEPTLETYLLKASQHKQNNIPVMEILWKYYESNNNHAAAAKVLDALASSNNTLVGLKDRVNYLTRSLMCMRSNTVGFAPHIGIFLQELEVKLEVAKVQEKVLDAISAMRGRYPEAEPAEALLNSQLFELTQLYEDFAEKFQLWECKLAIIDCAGHSDEYLIEDIWRNILQNELSRSTSSGNDTMIHILSKVKILVKMYKPTNICVPLAYLLRELELISTKLKASPNLVPDFFVTMEYPFDVLITKYNEAMYSTSKDNFWLTEENEFHYCEAMAALINAFVLRSDNYNSVEKRKIIAMSQDAVASMLSNLYSKPNTENIISQLRCIQLKLVKM